MSLLAFLLLGLFLDCLLIGSFFCRLRNHWCLLDDRLRLLEVSHLLIGDHLDNLLAELAHVAAQLIVPVELMLSSELPAALVR